MSYTPANDQIFNAALTGAMGGMMSSGRVPLSTSVAGYGAILLVVGAWAQSFDQAWDDAGNESANALNVYAATQLSHGEWLHRSPASNAVARVSDTYDARTAALVAMILAGEAYDTSQGITPPSIGGGSGGTLDGDVTGPSDNNIVSTITGTGIGKNVDIFAENFSADTNLSLRATGGNIGIVAVSSSIQVDTTLGISAFADPDRHSAMTIDAGGFELNAVRSDLGGALIDIRAVNSVLSVGTDTTSPSGVNASIQFDGISGDIDCASTGDTTFTTDQQFGIVSTGRTLISAATECQISTAKLTLAVNSQDTVGAAGGAAALPLTPSHYLQVTTNDGDFLIPVYNRP